MCRKAIPIFLVGFAALGVCGTRADSRGFPPIPTRPVFEGVDPSGDALVRATDPGAIGPVDLSTHCPQNSNEPNTHCPPDFLRLRMGNWRPFGDPRPIYDGEMDPRGGFFRIDLDFTGLMNPPGSIGVLEDAPFMPFLYGRNPIFGWVELDVDADIRTGGETDAPGFRYLGNIARFGGRPVGPRFLNRVATSARDTDPRTPITDEPYCQRSGEEFHLALFGDFITSMEEVIGNGNRIFERGESWLVRGSLLHRAHGYERYSFSQGPPIPGAYEPNVELRFQHRWEVNETRISLIYPLTNSAWANFYQLPAQPMNANAVDQNSILEALIDLRNSAINTPVRDRDVDFILMQAWEEPDHANLEEFLSAGDWEPTVLVGMSYVTPTAPANPIAWTDAFPGVLNGDVSGDGTLNSLDAQQIGGFLIANGSQAECDGPQPAPGNAFGCAPIPDFGPNFSLYDLNYDGQVDSYDLYRIIIPGDANGDLSVTTSDIPTFLGLLLRAANSPNPDPLDLLRLRADMNRDGRLDGRDVGALVESLTREHG